MVGLTAQAIPITGAVSFSGIGPLVTDTGDLSTANAINSFGSVVTSVPNTGSYAGVGALIPVTMAGFTFKPALSPSPVSPLWTFTDGTLTYDFNMSSLLNVIQTSDKAGQALTINGAGTLEITGLDPTPGTWKLTANQAGASLSFSASSQAVPRDVPDGGMTVTLLGAALAALGVVRRRLSA